MIKVSVSYQQVLETADMSELVSVSDAEDQKGILETGDMLSEPFTTTMIFNDWNRAVDYYRAQKPERYASYPLGFITVVMDDNGKTDEKTFKAGF